MNAPDRTYVALARAQAADDEERDELSFDSTVVDLEAYLLNQLDSPSHRPEIVRGIIRKFDKHRMFKVLDLLAERHESDDTLIEQALREVMTVAIHDLASEIAKGKV